MHAGIGLPLLPHAARRTPTASGASSGRWPSRPRPTHWSRAAADPELELRQMWATGLPRHDFLVRRPLPADLAAEESRLRERMGDRRLVVWWADGALPPHARRDRPDRRLGARAHDVAIGIREPRVERAHGWTLGLAADTERHRQPQRPHHALVHPDPSGGRRVVTDRVAEAFDALVLGTPLLQSADAARRCRLRAATVARRWSGGRRRRTCSRSSRRWPTTGSPGVPSPPTRRRTPGRAGRVAVRAAGARLDLALNRRARRALPNPRPEPLSPILLRCLPALRHPSSRRRDRRDRSDRALDRDAVPQRERDARDVHPARA